MSDLSIWIVIVGMTLVTIAARSSFLVLGEHYALPARIQRALRYAPACALTALITPELFLVQGSLDLATSAPKLIAGVTAGVLMLTTRSMIATMVGGMAVFTVLRWL